MATMSFIAVFLLCAGAVAIAQEDPWPPLITTCNVMPLLAADANTVARDIVACASTSYPTCEVINCQVLSNSDQVELELLPCWQKPAMWIKSRKIDGTVTYQDIFASSRIAGANIGGQDIKLNVTAIQRNGLTLGFGVDVIFSDGTSRTIFPYRDIPLNLTECPGGAPSSLLCKMILYMEQFIISSASTQHNPMIAPTCDKPPESCDTMQCQWTDDMGTDVSHNYKFQPCSNPQSIRFILRVGRYVYNMTFWESKIVQLNTTTKLNFTLLHPSETTVGLAISMIITGEIVSLIPYSVLPLDRSDCTQEEGGLSESPKVSPLITTCDVMPLLVRDANTNNTDLVKCTGSTFPNCESISCIVLPTNDQFEVKLLPCKKVPAVSFVFKDVGGNVIFKDIFNSSRMVGVSIGKYVVNVSVTIIQGSGITLGFGVVFIMPLDHAHVPIFPFREIPLTFTECPGAIPPNYPAMCTMIDYMEQYIVSTKSNGSYDPSLMAKCDRPPATCDLMNCYWKDAMGTPITHKYTFQRCSNPQTVGLNLQVGLHFYGMSFSESKMVVLNMTTTLNFTLLHPTNTSVGIAVVIIKYGNNNVILPYTVLPMDKNGCKSHRETPSMDTTAMEGSDRHQQPSILPFEHLSTENVQRLQSSPSSSVITTCDVMPYMAWSLNNVTVPERILNCSTPSDEDCHQINCDVLGSDDTFVFLVQPCTSPPSFGLTVRNGTGDIIFQQSIDRSMQVNVELTAETIPIHFTIIKHYNLLTLGLSVEAEIDEGNTTTLVPYFEIPLNISQCPGATVLTPTCAVMQNLAQYLTIYMTNLTRDTEDTWNCASYKNCLRWNCTYGKHLYYVVSISECDKSLTLIKGYTNGTILFKSKMTGSGIHSISAEEFLTAIVQYHPDTFSLELQVTIITTITSNSSVASPFIPRLEVPLNLTECADNKTASSLAQSAYLIDTCVVMPQLANMASWASDGVFECSSLPRPYCNKMACRETSSGDILTVEILPCYGRGSPKVSIMNMAVDGKVTMNEVFSSSLNFSLTRIIGGQPSQFIITVVNHDEPLTLGVAISLNVTTGSGYKKFKLISYSEIPLDFTYCPELAGDVPTATCRVMDSIAQFLNVYIKNDTHKNDNYCTATRESYCNSIYCKNSLSNSGFNMTFLPCGPRVAYHTADSGSSTGEGYNFTIYSSSLSHFTPRIAGNITLYQVNTTTVEFAVMLIVDNVPVGYEVPPVTIPLDRQGCNASAPQSDPYARVSTCDVMPSLAASASAFAPNILTCTSIQDCSGFSCLVSSNDDTLKFQLLPCYYPPAIRVSTIDIRGGVLFNKSRGSYAGIVPVRDGSNVMETNLTIIHHRTEQTLGLKIDANLTTGSGTINGQFVPYFELPLDRTSCLPISMSNRTETCKVMDALAQYMTVFFANATRTPGLPDDECYADHGPSSLCNSIVCNFLGHNMSANLQFRPCNNPVGLTFTYYSNMSSENTTYQRFIFRDAAVQISPSTFAIFNITPHGSNNVDFQMTLEASTPDGFTTLLQVPFSHIPLDSAVCGSNHTIPDGHHNHTHNNNSHTHNHTSSSIADLCTIMPGIAREVSRTQGPLSLQCTTPFDDCNTLHCFLSMGMLQRYQQNLTITVIPCTNPPQLEVTVPSNRGTAIVAVYMRSSERIESVINGSTVPIFFNINQRASLLSIGLEVIVQMNATSNITIIPYKEIPLDRSDCQTALSSACASLSNISQYLNFALSDFTVQPTDCSYSSGCDGIQCSLGRSQGMLSFSLQPCDLPPSVLGTATYSNGTEMFDRTIINHQIIPWNLFSEGVFFNITLLHYNSSVLGFELNLMTLSHPESIELVPSTIIPLLTTACSTSSTPTLPPVVVTNGSSFITTCDIVPLIALSTSVLGTNDMTCSSSSPPNCSTITCMVSATHDGFTIELKPCFYPPSIIISNMVNGTQVSHKIFGKTTALSYTIGGQTVPLTVELHQHTDYLSLGLQVFATISGRLSNFIPYREIPMNRSQCSPASLSPTCQIMEHVSQYITVFMGNASTTPYKTPDCYPDTATFCNRITCRFNESREVFNFTIDPCSKDPSLPEEAQQATFESSYFDGRASIFREYKPASSMLRFMNADDANLIFNNLDSGDTVQVKLTVTTGEFAGVLIPMVTVPVDKTFCHKPGRITTASGSNSMPSTSSSGTPEPKNSNSTNLIIAITVGAGGIFLLVIIILCGVVFIISCQGKKMSSEPYMYRPLSDAEDAEDRLEYSVERTHPRPVRDQEHEQQPGFPASRDTERRLPRQAGDDDDDY